MLSKDDFIHLYIPDHGAWNIRQFYHFIVELGGKNVHENPCLYDSDLKSVCVVVPIDSETCELKNIATYEKYQGKGYGKVLLKFIFDFYKNDYKTMLVGTGETPTILSFYESCGFEKSYWVRNFFTDNYDHLIFEGEIQLVDMIYLKKDFENGRERE